ncbi:sodium-dependent phosphate transport protein 2B-like [Elysia marginata]|uniref:Sodium-dependent phosphate transport protein 2B-like n=1 Tax=Elysia marginata TaxID=1093978 RepID=A0AAV4JLZ3_9GAST|nr:sodium-dependent phosphate transport protein 2B-like [Elysia marginata]
MDEGTQTSTWLLDQLLSSHKSQTDGKNNEREKTAWKDLNTLNKSLRVAGVVMRLGLLLAVLYCFICSLGLLEDSFKLLGGRAAGEAFRNSALLSNPVAGLMIGVMATVLVQSSSTATSIMVAMVASQVLPLQSTIPIVMGTNVGTSITSTLVSLAQAADREQFRRAFSGATVSLSLKSSSSYTWGRKDGGDDDDDDDIHNDDDDVDDDDDDDDDDEDDDDDDGGKRRRKRSTNVLLSRYRYS